MNRAAVVRALDTLLGSEEELGAEDATDRLRRATRELFDELTSGAGLERPASEAPDEAGMQVLGGIALGPSDAGRCLLDFRRTNGFVRALEAGVLEARARFTERPIELLYAGCGPLATLALPLTRRFGPEELRITLVDAHRRSLESAWRIVNELQLARSFAEPIHGDVARLELPGRGTQVVVVEAMQRALEREPQFALTAALARRVRADAVWIPQRIAIDAWLADPARETGERSELRSKLHERRFLGSVLELTPKMARRLWDARRPFAERESLPPVELRAPDDCADLHLMLRTTLELFGPHRLDENDSGITLPRYVHALGRIPAGARIELRYLLGDRPGFRCRLLPS